MKKKQKRFKVTYTQGGWFSGFAGGSVLELSWIK